MKKPLLCFVFLLFCFWAISQNRIERAAKTSFLSCEIEGRKYLFTPASPLQFYKQQQGASVWTGFSFAGYDSVLNAVTTFSLGVVDKTIETGINYYTDMSGRVDLIIEHLFVPIKYYTISTFNSIDTIHYPVDRGIYIRLTRIDDNGFEGVFSFHVTQSDIAHSVTVEHGKFYFAEALRQ